MSALPVRSEPFYHPSAFFARSWEEMVERAVERLMDAADKLLMSGEVSQADYDAWTRRLDKWAEQQFAR